MCPTAAGGATSAAPKAGRSGTPPPAPPATATTSPSWARQYLAGLVAGLDRTNGWTLAERAGDVSPGSTRTATTRSSVIGSWLMRTCSEYPSGASNGYEEIFPPAGSLTVELTSVSSVGA
jgi:hypothetical protein